MSTYTRHAVVGYFNTEISAREAVKDLVDSGFQREQVHCTTSNDYATDAATGGAGLTGRAPSENQGGFMGWFKSLFESNDYDEEATRYSERARAGGSVVAVDATDQNRDRAVEILNQHGATDIDDSGTASNTAQRNIGSTTQRNAASTTQRNAPSTNQSVEGERRIPVVQEDLQIGKRPVQSGGVRVYSRAVQQPVEEQVRLRQERVVVDRQPADRPVTAADEAAWRDQTIEVREMKEEPVVQKRARVVEEVRVGKEATERTETVRDNLRRTEVKTEPLTGTQGTQGTQSNYDYTADYRRDFESRYGASGGDYQTYAPAYTYGSTMGADPRYKGKKWNEVEADLRADYGRRYPGSTWERMKDAVRYGWDKVTGQR